MSSAAAYAIENGLDPFIGSDWLPRETPNRLYDIDDDDRPSRTREYDKRVEKGNTKKNKSFSNFQQAWAFSKSVAPSTLKRDRDGFVVTFN